MKVTIPIRGSDFEEEYVSFDLFVDEIPTLSDNPNLILLIDDYKKTQENGKGYIEKITFQVIREENEIGKYAELINKAFPRFETEYILEYLILNIQLYDDESSFEYSQSLINDILNRLCFLINLSYSTNVDFLPGVIYSYNEEFIDKTKMIGSDIMFAYAHAKKINWPCIRNLKLIDTINWFNKFAIHPNDKSTNNAHRAINAFSYLFDDLNIEKSDHLFWVMLGIEALLAKGINGISNQIREKSAIILGKPTEYTRQLNKLYDYRSRLIHGDTNINPAFHFDYHSFKEAHYDYLAFGTSILIALIRELIYKQKTEFEFELKLK
ncbi:HEPN domain-containing protein [Sunxiuqinia elliptica]|uniref:Uncharacterized protein n=1 Tax=Sunxiuqinia elliptica TaxID=655355 RepID=A0A4R6H0Q4_9BACT|nr:HEPN domain-containing protein [Sunxiuqinia elliptica]TDO01248.1 hypothetical protein DET52_105103 [Sunxiuqinia elliptica]TDO57759.1 hypothetical protein DET65_3353 [Sunxiuqinia elliptica]